MGERVNGIYYERERGIESEEASELETGERERDGEWRALKKSACPMSHGKFVAHNNKNSNIKTGE